MVSSCPSSGPHKIVPLSACQIITARFAAVATSRPSGDIETDWTFTRCSESPSRGTFSTCPSLTLHLETTEPSLATIVLSSSRAIAARNRPEPPGEFFRIGSASKSKNRIVLSSPPNQYGQGMFIHPGMWGSPVISCFMSGENRTELTQDVWPYRGSQSFCPVGIFHRRTVPSSEPEASSFPSFENARDLTGCRMPEHVLSKRF